MQNSIMDDRYRKQLYNSRETENLTGEFDSVSENRLRLKFHFEHTPLAIIEWDANFKVVKWNPAAERIFGYTESEAAGKTAIELIVLPEDQDYVISLFDQLKVLGGGRRSKNRNIRKDKRIITCEWYNSSIINDNGELVSITSLIEDVTDTERNHKIQQALFKISQSVNSIEDINQLYIEIHQIVKGLMKADNFYISLYDESTNVISFPYFVDEFDSKPQSRKLGRGLTEYILRQGNNLLIDAQEDLHLREAGETDLLGQPAEIWLGVCLKNNDKIIGAIVLQDYSDKTTYGEEEMQILTYVSEQIASAITKKRTEEELKKYSRELQELNASKDKFFSIIAHDIRSPFHGLLGLVSILRNEFDYLSTTEQKSYIDEIHSSINNIHALAENLLDWSKLKIGGQRFNPSFISLHDFVDDVISILQQNANIKMISIDNRIPDAITVTGDVQMLRTLFHNLISNAIKYSGSGGKIVIDTLKVSSEKILVKVTDNGIGIKEENVSRLFKIDENFSTPGTNNEKGSGLGLYLCAEIVEAHGSELKVTSEPGKGSTFSFHLNSV